VLRHQEATMAKSFQISLAPQRLWQAINPWTFYQQGAQLGFINIDLGQTPHPEVEQAVLDEVGSYGRQLGRIGDALEVLLKHIKLKDLNQAERDALDVLQGQLAAVRQVKKRVLKANGSYTATTPALSTAPSAPTTAPPKNSSRSAAGKSIRKMQ
jgi:hypothetical protein